MAQQRKTKVIPNAGAKRVAAQAADVFSDILHETAMQIAEKAAMIARHSGRKTVHEGDVKLAARR